MLKEGQLDGTGEDIPGHRILDGTDLEIAYNLADDDLVLRVNKSGVQILRVKLDGALKELTNRQLVNFNGVARILCSRSATRRSECWCWGAAWGSMSNK